MHHFSVSWEITLQYFFSWKFIESGQKEPIKVQNFRLSSAHVKFHQICGSFCWKYIKFQLKKYRGLVSHNTEEWFKIWRKTNMLFKKWQEFGGFWFEHSKGSKICTLIGLFCAKNITFDLKKYRGVIFDDIEVPCTIWRKTDLWFGEWHEEVGKFSPEVLKLGLWWDAFSQSRKCVS